MTEQEYVLERLINSNAAGEGSSLPPRLLGDSRVPTVSGFRVAKTESYFGGTQFSLMWEEPEYSRNLISHFNIYYTEDAAASMQWQGPLIVAGSPGIVRIITPTASRITFKIQTQLYSGQVSDLEFSPTTTGLSTTAALSAAEVTPHPILSANHSDTTTGTVLQGDLITGQGATPKWTRLGVGAAGTYLRTDGTDAVWDELYTADIAAADKQGNGTDIQMFGGGATVSGNAAVFDANGNVIDGGVPPAGTTTMPYYRKYTVAYTDAAFYAADVNTDVVLFTLPQYGKIHSVTIKHSTQFTDGAGAMTEVSVSVGRTGAATYYAGTQNIGEATAVADTTFLDANPGGKSNTMAAAGQDVRAFFIATDRNFGDGAATYLTAGSVSIWILWSVIQ